MLQSFVALVGSVVLCQIMAICVMFTNSYLLGSLSNDDLDGLQRIITISLCVNTLFAVFQAFVLYFRDRLALEGQISLVFFLEDCVRGQLKLSKAVPAPNLDQRITADADSFCTNIAELIETCLVVVSALLFYVYFIVVKVGYGALLFCFMYISLSVTVTYQVSRYLTPIVVKKGQVEGEFRLIITNLMKNWSTIFRLRGGSSELDIATEAFNAVVANQGCLIRQNLFVNLSSQWFGYTSNVVSYAIVGSTLVFISHHAVPPDNRLEYWSQGSFACMAILDAFARIYGSFDVWSTSCGQANRILEVILRQEVNPSNQKGIIQLWGQYCRAAAVMSRKVRAIEVREDDESAAAADAESSWESSLQTTLLPSTYSKPIRDTKPNFDRYGLVPSMEECETTASGLEERELEVVLKIRDADVAYHVNSSSGASSTQTLIQALSFQLGTSDRLLISGPSGSGKSSLLQYIFDCVHNSDQEKQAPLVVFCPQQPYVLLQRTPMENFLYPFCLETSDRMFAQSMLQELGQGRLLAKENCSNLAMGEKQILGVTRALCSCEVHRRNGQRTLLLLDEITSAMDEELEQLVYATIRKYCAYYISVGHRSTVQRFHNKELRLHRDTPTWEVLDRGEWAMTL